MFTITRATVLVVATCVATTIFAQTRRAFTGTQASQLVPKAQQVITDAESNPTFIRFQDNTSFKTISSFPQTFGLAADCDFRLLSTEKDKLGFEHLKYQETYKGLRIMGAEYVFHTQGAKVIHANGRMHREVALSTTPSLSEAQALERAIAKIGASSYMWESKDSETLLRQETNDPNATYFPKGELAISSENYRKEGPLQLVYVFDIYATEPLGRYHVEVGAHNGRIVNQYDRIHHTVVPGSGTTLYDGNVSMNVTQSGGIYQLADNTRGDGVYTYDLQNGTTYSDAVLFSETDTNFDEVENHAGVSAHYGAGATYDYFLNNHGRNSFDNAGAAIRSYVHYSSNYVNAFWDGSRMTYGDGNGTTITALVSLDIVGHEIAHAVTQYTAGLIYQDESGALNESFSDIFGQSIEFETFPAAASWDLGDQIFTGPGMIRSISDPNTQGQPDTYLGDLWYTGAGDNGGVHYNSGVQNFWYYLLVEGGTGTNDFGYDYNVPSIGRTAADAIAYRNLSVYLTSGSTYIDARIGAEQSAIDLYGENSFEHLAVVEAWNAVGVPTTDPVLAVVSALDMGFGIINTTSTVALNVENRGYSTLEVTGITIGDDVYEVASTSFSVEAQQSYALDVSFSPTALQAYVTDMTIFSNADTLTVELSGVGANRPDLSLSEDHLVLTHAAGEIAEYPITISNNNTFPVNIALGTDIARNAQPTFVPAPGMMSVGKESVPAYMSGMSLTGEDTVSGYNWRDTDSGVSFDWLDIQSLGTAVVLGDDDLTGLIPLGFDFPFFEEPFSNVTISSNGWISFTETVFGLWATPLPHADAPANVIAWMAHDLYPGTSCHYYRDTDNNRFIIQYTNWTDWATRTGDYTVQIHLYESGRVLILYQTAINPKNGTVGLQNGDKTAGMTISYAEEAFFRNNYAIEIDQNPLWLEPSVQSISLAANSSRTFNANINASKLLAGDYRGHIQIGLPDYNTIADSVTVDLTIDGTANLQLPSALSFGSALLGEQKEQVLQLINNGSDELTILSFSLDDGVAFSTDAAGFTLQPLGDTSVVVQFEPPALGSYTDSLRVMSNNPDRPVRTVALSGKGTLEANLSVFPDSIGVTLEQDASTSRTVTLSNPPNAADLTYSIGYRNASSVLSASSAFNGAAPQPDGLKAGDAVAAGHETFTSGPLGVPSAGSDDIIPLAELKSSLDFSHGFITALIPERFDFTGGDVGTSISDGGDDLYDGGNFLSTNFTGPISYTSGVIFGDEAFGNSSYFTAKYPGLFVLAADLGGVGSFRIEGNLGADGGGSVDGSVLQHQRSGKTYLGFVKRVYAAGDPSVNHLIIVENNGLVSHEFSTDTNNDFHAVSDMDGLSRMYYLLFSAGVDGTYIDDDVMTAIMESFLDLVDDNSWLNSQHTDGILPGGESVDLEFTIDAAGLEVGSYKRYIIFSNDGITPSVEVPVTLEVSGEEPSLSVDQSSIAFGTLAVGEQKEDSVLLTNESPSTVNITEIALDHTDFQADGAPFTLTAGASRWIPFTYASVSEGPVSAEAIIRHDGVGGDIGISLSGIGQLPPGNLSISSNAIDLGTVVVGQQAMDSVQLTNAGPASVLVSSITISNADFGADGGVFTLAANESQWVVFSYNPQAPGPAATTAVIQHNGVGGEIEVTLTAVGEAAPGALSANRDSIDFGAALIGSEILDSVRLTNTGGSLVTITEIALGHTDFEVDTAPFSLDPAEEAWVVFRYAAITEGPVSAVATIRHDGEGDDINITLEAEGIVPIGSLSANRDTMDFGDVMVGSTESDSVLLTNAGTAVLTISEIVLVHDEFQTDDLIFTLDPGEDRWIYFHYAAQTEGATSGAVIIRHDGAGGDLTIELTGTGIPEPVAEPPVMEVYPGEVISTADVGGSAIENLTIDNSSGGSDLEWAIDIASLQVDQLVGAPDGYGHQWLDSDVPGSPAFEWVDIAGTGIDISDQLTDDNVAGPFDLGFTVKFYDRTFDSFYIGSNGFIRFDDDPATGCCTGLPMGEADGINNVIAWSWLDGTPQTVKYEVLNGKTVILFENYQQFENPQGGSLTAQVVLYSNGNIQLNYLEVGQAFAENGGSIGIENFDGTDGLQVSYNEAFLHDELSIFIERPGRWLSVSESSGVVPGGSSQSITVLMDAAKLPAGTYTAELQLTANDPINPSATVPLTFTVEGLMGSLVLSEGSIDMGAIITSGTVSSSVRVDNQGHVPMQIVDVIGLNANFSVNPGSGTIMPGSSMDFEIAFSPQWEGTFSTSLTFETDIPNAQALDLQVTGSGVGPYLIPSRQVANFPAEAGQGQIVVETNIETITATSVADWLSFQLIEGASTNMPNLVINYEDNPSVDIRQAAVTISGGGLSRSVLVSQAGRGPYIEVSQDTVTLAAEGGTFDLIVDTSLEDWLVEGVPSWMTFSLSGDTIQVSYSQNPAAEREKTVVIGHGELTEEVHIRQVEAAAYMFVSGTQFEVDRGGATLTIPIETNVALSVATLADWLAIDVTMDGLVVDVERLRGPRDRSGTIEVSGSGVETVTITIDQLKHGEVLDVEQEPTLQLSFYPNPVQDRLIVESPELKDVELFSANGSRAVPAQMSDRGKAIIDLNDTQEGLYFLKAEMIDGTFRIEKVIVKR